MIPLIQAQPNPCASLDSLHIVVLGSSTAAGAGASTADSAWVSRYRHALQALNPANALTNLAQGGYNTFRLMPTGFVPPPGRPSPDTTRNITAALSLQPDAIIINLPSNDAGIGHGVAGQLANFDTILSLAALAGVPVWMCTTQPRNYSNQNTLQIQLDMRDSILIRYTPRVLDFWSGLEDSTSLGWIDPAFDSGDGVHLNDAGHALLYQRARAADLPGQLYEAPSVPDLALARLPGLISDLCGDANQWLPLLLHNLGASSSDSLDMYLQRVGPAGDTIMQSLTYYAALGTCETDTIGFWLDMQAAGSYALRAWLAANDTFAGNDSLSWAEEVTGTPQLAISGDTLCVGDSSLLLASASAGDRIYWYADAAGDSILGQGPLLELGPVDSSRQVYAQAARGLPYFSDSLVAQSQPGIHWNGFMFDLIATETLTLDSLAIRIFDPGQQAVEIYVRDSTHQGAELTPNAWTLHATDTVFVPQEDAWTMLHFPAMDLATGDTLAIYLQLSTPSARLSYAWATQPATTSTPELTLWSGSGISHQFSAVYFPRHLNARLFYHFGHRPLGDCASALVPVDVWAHTAPVASFTGSFSGDTLWLSPTPSPGATYLWDLGQGPQDLGDSTVFAMPEPDSLIEISLLVSNACGTDTATQSFLLSSLGLPASSPRFSIGPNPFQDQIGIRGEGHGHLWLELWDAQGRKVQERGFPVQGSWEIDWKIPGVAAGLYILTARLGENRAHWRVQATPRD